MSHDAYLANSDSERVTNMHIMLTNNLIKMIAHYENLLT